MNRSTIYFRSVQAIVLLLFISSYSTILAQTANIPMHNEIYPIHSGVFSGTPEQSGVQLVFSEIIGIAGVPWLNVHFSDFYLGDNSYITIASILNPRDRQVHRQTTLEQWNGFSAFFNGDAVEVKLYVASSDQNVFIETDELIVGEWAGPNESQCGPTDDRIFSFDDRAGRLLNVGCTAWLIPNGKLVTAGHCVSSAGGANIVEFNVPQSTSGGTLQHPGPEDQYSVISSSRVYQDAGIGNDWGVFAVNPNPVTLLMPIVAQGDYFTLVQNLGPDSIRITGYGVDQGVANQTQQTHVGPNAASSGTVMRYRTDTEGGNSGSPVIDALTNTALGVHTHGGCTSSGGNNNGTSFFHTTFWNAVDQGIPVELTSFTAELNIDKVVLNWTTATELNNKGFTVERKRKSTVVWENITFITGRGTSTETTGYSYSDTDLDITTYVYRLKQVDFDGTFTFSNEVEVAVFPPAEYSLYQNYPNPFNPSTTIKFSLPETTQLNITIFNSLGEKVADVFSGTLEEGFHSVQFDATELSSGVYFYRLETGSFVKTMKMMLMK